MRQFDICGLRHDDRQMVLVLQHGHVDDLATVIVAPLAAVAEPMISRIRFAVTIGGRNHVVQLDRMAAIARREMGETLATLAARQDEIKAGIDLLFYGF
jgi:hypothetical protein